MIRIDARGMKCPWPAIRLSRALRGGATHVEVIADDPKAPDEMAAVATAAGAVLRRVENTTGPTFVAIMTSDRNGVFTLSR